jgi:hypothetical protein
MKNLAQIILAFTAKADRIFKLIAVAHSTVNHFTETYKKTFDVGTSAEVVK